MERNYEVRLTVTMYVQATSEAEARDAAHERHRRQDFASWDVDVDTVVDLGPVDADGK